MSFNLPFGVFVAANVPVDADRYKVATTTQRDALVTGGRAYEGLQVYVDADKVVYILKGATNADWEVFSGGSGGSQSFQQTTDIGNSTTNDIEIQGNLELINPGELNPFGAKLNVNLGAVTAAGNNFPIYNAINKRNATNTTDLVYGISNLIEHDGDGDIAQLRGAFNRVRSDGTGTPQEMIGFFNEASYRNMGTGTVPLVSASENFVIINESGSAGTITSALGVRGKVEMDSSSETLGTAFGGVFELELSQGTVGNFVGVSIDVDQSAGTTINGGSFLQLETGIDITQAQANGVTAINSLVDLPSQFVGEILMDKSPAQIDAEASGLILVNRNWITAQGFSTGGTTFLGYNESGDPAVGSQDLLVDIGKPFLNLGDPSVNLAGMRTDQSNAVVTIFTNDIVGSNARVTINSDRINLDAPTVRILEEIQLGLGTSATLRSDNVNVANRNIQIPNADGNLAMSATDGTTIVQSDVNGLLDLSSLSFGGGSNIYTADGTINGDREITMAAASSFSFLFASDIASTFFIGESGLAGEFGLEMTFDEISIGSHGQTGMNWTTNNSFELIAVNGLQIRPSNTGSLTSNTIGQVLTAIGTNGECEWQDLPGGGGGGDVFKVGVPVDGQIGVWTGDGTIEGDPTFELETIGVVGKRLNIGTNDSVAGFIQLFGGANSGSNSGVRLFTSSGDDTNVEFWDIVPWDGGVTGSLRIGGAGLGDDSIKIDDATGIVRSPITTNANVDAADGKVLVPKEWVEANYSQVTEGTFTPTIVDSGGGLTYTPTTANGFYQRVGNTVHFQITIATVGVTGSATGTTVVDGLPFPPVNSEWAVNVGRININGADPNLETLRSSIFGTTGGIRFYVGSNGSTTSAFTSIGTLVLSGTYQTT